MRRISLLSKRMMALLILLAISSAGCSILNSGRIDCNSSSYHGYTPVLPPSASNVKASCSDLSYQGSFTMSASDLSTFQQSTFISNIKNWQISVPANSIFSQQAAQAKSLLYGSSTSGGAIAVDVLIDTSDSQSYKTYV